VLQPVLQCLSGAGSTFTLNARSDRGVEPAKIGMLAAVKRRNHLALVQKAAAAIEAWLGAGARAPGGNLQYGY